MDRLIHGIAAGGTVRVIAAVTTDTVAEAVRRHRTSPTISAAFGRVLTGTLLLGATLKEFDRLTVKIECNGAAEAIVAETNARSKVRGYVRNPQPDLPTKDNGKFDVSGVIGGGMFHVIREVGFDVGLYQAPYHGSVPVVSGEIAEDFAYYLAKSEQIPSAVLLGVLLQNREPYVAAAGGVMLQMMPGVNEHVVTIIEDNIRHAPHLTSIIDENTAPQDLARLALGEIDFEILDEKEVGFACNCSRERAAALIASLGRDEVAAMLSEDRGATMTCGFCNETYRLDEKDLQEILNSAS
jgi:molecular chaperone Hsp33